MTDSRLGSEPRGATGAQWPWYLQLAWMLAVAAPALPAPTAGPAAASPGSNHAADEQPARLVGEVRDPRGPVPHANIVLRRAKCGSISDERGWFAVVGIPPGRWQVEVVSAGYVTRHATIEFAAGGTETLAVVLAEAPPREPGRTIKMRPGMVVERPDMMARVGRKCESHPWAPLLADTVAARHGIVVTLPGDNGPVRDSFPNANEYARAGCVDNQEREQTAYCPECRRALHRWLAREAHAAAHDSSRAR